MRWHLQREYNYLARKMCIIIRWQSSMRNIKSLWCHMAKDERVVGKRQNHENGRKPRGMDRNLSNWPRYRDKVGQQGSWIKLARVVKVQILKSNSHQVTSAFSLSCVLGEKGGEEIWLGSGLGSQWSHSLFGKTDLNTFVFIWGSLVNNRVPQKHRGASVILTGKIKKS